MPISDKTLNPTHIQKGEAQDIHEMRDDNQDEGNGQQSIQSLHKAVHDRKEESAAVNINIKMLSGWAIPPHALAPLAHALRQYGQQFDRGEFRVDEWDAQTLMALATSWAHEAPKENTGEIPNRQTSATHLEIEHILECAATTLGLSASGQRHETTESETPKECWLVGWSLGGMLAVALAHRYPESVTGVITLGANACFSTQADWPNAMPRSTFEQFYKRFQRSPERALKRFAFLCTSCNAHSTLSGAAPMSPSVEIDQEKLEPSTPPEALTKPARCPQALAQLLEADMQASLDSISTRSSLRKGLDLLGELDNREALVALQCPQLHLFAEGDMLVPLSATEDIEALIRLNNKAECAVVQGVHNFPMVAAEASASVIHHFIQHHSIQHHNIHPQSHCAR